MDPMPKFEWLEHDVSTRRAKVKKFYWTLHLGDLDKDIASVETKEKSFEAYCYLPGADNYTKKRYFKTADEAKQRAEALVLAWLEAVFKGATPNQTKAADESPVRDVQGHEED